MPVTYVSSLNARPDTNSSSGKFSFYTTFQKTLADDEQVVMHLPKSVRWCPTTIALSATSNVAIDGTCSPYESIEAEVAGDDTGGEDEPTTPIWGTITPAALTFIQGPLTAVRIKNESGAPIKVEIIL